MKLTWAVKQMRYQGNARTLCTLTYLPVQKGEGAQW